MPDKVAISADEDIYNDLGWSPSEYGFKLIVPGTDKINPVWKKWTNSGRVFMLIRIARTLFVLKKEVKNTDENGSETIRRLIKFHTVIDSKPLADVYLTSGLRG